MTEVPPGLGPVEAIAPGTRLREWQVVRRVGRGAFGVVFEAERSSWIGGERRAIKVFDPLLSRAARDALIGEFSVLRGDWHPNLITGHDAFDIAEGDFAGCVVFVMDLAGPDLLDEVTRRGPLPPEEVASLAADIGEGLDALHARDLVHGDVKPENLLRSEAGWALADFGVSAVLEGSYASGTGTTVDYRPPEFARAEEGATLHRSADVWALGVAVHVAATGHHPFPGPDPFMRYAAVLRGDRERRPLPEPAGTIVERCLDHDPRRRPTAAEVRDLARPSGPSGRGTGSAPPWPAPSPADPALAGPVSPSGGRPDRRTPSGTTGRACAHPPTAGRTSVAGGGGWLPWRQRAPRCCSPSSWPTSWWRSRSGWRRVGCSTS